MKYIPISRALYEEVQLLCAKGYIFKTENTETDWKLGHVQEKYF